MAEKAGVKDKGNESDPLFKAKTAMKGEQFEQNRQKQMRVLKDK